MTIKIGDVPEWVRETVCSVNLDCRECPFYSAKRAEESVFGGGCRKYDYDYADDEVWIDDEYFHESEDEEDES